MKKFKAFKKDDKVWAQAINPYSSFWETRQYVDFENVNPPILSPSLTDGEVYREEDLEYPIDECYSEDDEQWRDCDSGYCTNEKHRFIARLKQPKEAPSTEKEESVEVKNTLQILKEVYGQDFGEINQPLFNQFECREAMHRYAEQFKQQTQKAIDDLVEKYERKTYSTPYDDIIEDLKNLSK